MSRCAFVCVSVCVSCVSSCVFALQCVSLYVCTGMCLLLCLFLCICQCACVSVSVCVNVYLYIFGVCQLWMKRCVCQCCLCVCQYVLVDVCGVCLCREALAHYVLRFSYLASLNAWGQKLRAVDYNTYFDQEAWRGTAKLKKKTTTTKKEVWKFAGFVWPSRWSWVTCAGTDQTQGGQGKRAHECSVSSLNVCPP